MKIIDVDYGAAERPVKKRKRQKPTFEPGVDVVVRSIEPEGDGTGQVVRDFLETGGGSVADIEFCFTGFRDDVLQRRLERAGATVSMSFRPKSTGVLIAKEGGKPGKKGEEARKAGIPIVVISGGTRP